MTSLPEIPGFRIDGILGKGSMATVYRAFETRMNRCVALKVLRPDVLHDPKIVKRLLREARLAARLNHPGIVRALDAGIHNDACWFAMECVEGRTLRETVVGEGPLSEATVVRYALELGEALRHLHSQHIVHRDIKPANIIINASGNAMLADLGLAKIEFDSSMTSKDRAVGTPQFMSPEQARDPDSVDVRSDIFSLGSTIYFALTGHSPFEAVGVGAVITRILYDEVEPICSSRADCSEEIDIVVSKMLAKDRPQRYQTPTELTRDLRALIRGAKPVLASVACVPWYRRGVVPMAAILIAVGSLLVRGSWNHAGREVIDGSSIGSVLVERPDYESMSDANLASAIMQLPESGSADGMNVLVHRLELLSERVFDAAYSEAKSRNSRLAREMINLTFPREFKERFKVSIGECPQFVGQKFQYLQEAALVRVSEILRDDQQQLVRQIQSEYDLLTRNLIDAVSGLRDDEIEIRLRSHVPGQMSDLDADHATRVSAYIDQCISRIRAEKSADLQRRFEKIVAARRRFHFVDARRFLDEQRAITIRTDWSEQLMQLDLEERRIEEDEQALATDLRAFLASISRVGPSGRYPEIAERNFGPISEELERRISGLPEDSVQAGSAQELVHLMRDLRDVFAAVESWMSRIHEYLLRLPVGTPLTLILVDGSVLKDVRLIAVEGAVIHVEPDARIEISKLSSETLGSLVQQPEGALGSHCQLMLAYADGDLVRFAGISDSISPSDPITRFLNEKYDEALSIESSARTPVERDAHREWVAIMSLYRSDDWRRARPRLETLLANGEWTKTNWYRVQRKSILSLRGELTARVAFETVLEELHATTEILDWRSRRVRMTWVFRNRETLGDFSEIPFDSQLTEEMLIVPSRTKESRVAPEDVSVVRIDLPIDTSSGRVVVELECETLEQNDDPPRCLVVTVLGRHFAILSRLRRSSHMRTDDLHGVEELISEFVPVGQVATWNGAVDGHERAFVSQLKNSPKLVLEPGVRYRIRIVMDRLARTLTFSVDDAPILHETGVDSRPSEDAISVREAAGLGIHKLTVEAALR